MQIYSKEGFLLGIHTSALVVRTFLSIYVSFLDGVIVRNIVSRDGKAFAYSMFKWVAVAVPATFINSLIRFMESKLALALRTRMVKHCYAIYLSNQTYYRIQNLDNRLPNPDQVPFPQRCAPIAVLTWILLLTLTLTRT